MREPPFSRAIPPRHRSREPQGDFDQFEASELYCPQCRAAVPVNKFLLLILPDDIQSFSSNLDHTQLDSIRSSLKSTQVVLSLPKFEIAYDFSVPQVLKNLGMVDAFNPDQADFSGMDGSRDLFISDILHKAVVTVDENGTEAAAATAVIVGLTSIPSEQVTLTFDRPFLFFIMDDQTGSVLFLGRVMHP